MAAGPSKEQVTRAIRKHLQQARHDYGGTYIKGTVTTYPTVRMEGKWALFAFLQRASNGEACLFFHASTYEGGRVHYGPHKFTVKEAMDAAGISRQAQ